MREEYESQDTAKKGEPSRSSEIQASGFISRVRYIVLVPLLCLRRTVFDRLMVILSSVSRWQHHPITGYLIALLLQVVALGIILLIFHIFHDFAFLGLLSILATLIVALGW